jgi:hypothetical protein
MLPAAEPAAPAPASTSSGSEPAAPAPASTSSGSATDAVPTVMEPWMLERNIWLGGDVYATPAEMGVASRAALASIMVGAPQVRAERALLGQAAVPVVQPQVAQLSAWQALAMAAQAQLQGSASTESEEQSDPAESTGVELFGVHTIGDGMGVVPTESIGSRAAGEGPSPGTRRKRKQKKAPAGTEGLGQSNEHHICYGVWELHGGEVLATVEVPNTGRSGAAPYVCTWRLSLHSRRELVVEEHNMVRATADRSLAIEPSRVMAIKALEGDMVHYSPLDR